MKKRKFTPIKSKTKLDVLLANAFNNGKSVGVHQGKQDEKAANSQPTLNQAKCEFAKAAAELADANSKLAYAVSRILDIR